MFNVKSGNKNCLKIGNKRNVKKFFNKGYL